MGPCFVYFSCSGRLTKNVIFVVFVVDRGLQAL